MRYLRDVLTLVTASDLRGVEVTWVALPREAVLAMADLPTGTVTFLFTDIEESTRLWSDSREAMSAAVERHDTIVRSAIEDHDGYVFATGGDAFSAVFRSAQDALAAALTAQLVITGEEWGEMEPLLVRMGVHTGEAEERDDNYFGPVLNESARLMSAGHGGQILVSETAQRIAGSRLPDGVALVDLGEHRLKDVDHPISLYQVTHADLAVEFPALRGWVETRNNLPSQLTSFVGRDRELIELERLLETSRLVTLTGAGGSGKTRLAVELAGDQFDTYPDGVWFIDLAAVDDPMVVGAAVAATLGVSDVPGQKILDRLIARVSDQRVLLILDNCEHLIEGAASLASELLQGTEASVVVATSREPLGITGESAYPVPTLAGADGGGFTIDGPAVRLFLDRASMARPGLDLSGDDLGVVASICRRLDGLPLAIELAAARLSIFSPSELLARLDDRFTVLVGGARDRLPRQQTLAATLDWSYELLTEEEQEAFARLSVFSGGFTLEAAQEICAGERLPSTAILDLVAGLIDKSLVVSEQRRTDRRFGLLETIRAYAATKIPEAEDVTLRAAHADYFGRLAVDSFTEVWGAKEVAWLDRIEDEWPNIRRALASYSENNMTQDGLLVSGSLYRFAYRRHYTPEVLAWLEHFIESDVTPSAARARALLGIGTLSQEPGRFDEAIDLYRKFGPQDDLATSLNNAAVNAIGRGDYESARPLVEEALQILDETDPAGLSIALGLQAGIALEADHNTKHAIALREASLELARESNSPEATLQALRDLGGTRRHAADLDGAEAALQEALEIEARLGGRHAFIGGTEFALAEVALARADANQAVTYLSKHATLLRSLIESDETLLWFAAVPLHLWAEAALLQERNVTAVTLLATQTARLQESTRAQLPSRVADAKSTLIRARADLDPIAFEQAWAQGLARSGLEALVCAVDQLGSDAQTSDLLPEAGSA